MKNPFIRRIFALRSLYGSYTLVAQLGERKTGLVLRLVSGGGAYFITLTDNVLAMDRLEYVKERQSVLFFWGESVVGNHLRFNIAQIIIVPHYTMACI